ncbi:MAG: hypothetical protein Q7K39_04910 [Candidatus Magasanikbacteria bacterium]|nr:hypothetical protein [Candidatus Magasanikbacteria bacterium]
MSESNFLARHWKKLAAGVAALGITAGAVDMSRSRRSEADSGDAQGEVHKPEVPDQAARDMKALDNAGRLQNEERARERDQEKIVNVKAAIDAMFAQSPVDNTPHYETQELSIAELRAEGLEDFAKVVNEVPSLKIFDDSIDGPAVTYLDDQGGRFKLANIMVEDDGSFTLDGGKFNRGLAAQINVDSLDGLKSVLEGVKRNFVTGSLEDEQYDREQEKLRKLRQ